jgi:hypothetical protein
MATKKNASRRTNSSTGRAKPVVPKSGVTRDRRRRYGCGGKMKK